MYIDLEAIERSVMSKAQDEEITVESALKELQETFPDFEGASYDLVDRRLEVRFAERFPKYFDGENLIVVMSEVRKFRAWKESQQK